MSWEDRTESKIDYAPERKRDEWPRGPWDHEPDRIEWRHNGVPCLIVRNGFGALCGYAAVVPGHPWHGREETKGAHEDDYDTRPVDLIDVHGGLTYADRCSGHICHVAKPGEVDDVFWFGFDASHSGDLSPGLRSSPSQYETYRDVDYVRRQVESLADQLAAVKP